jgi:hypothetical protein
MEMLMLMLMLMLILVEQQDLEGHHLHLLRRDY